MSRPDELAEEKVIDGRFELGRLLGSGTFGWVIEARDRELRNSVCALKFLKPEWAEDKMLVELLRGEVTLARKVNNEHVCRIFDVYLQGRWKFFSMQLIEGESLAEIQAALSFEDKLDVCIQICKGLEALHAEKIFHRDLKPKNVMILQKDLRVKAVVVDLGVAKAETILSLVPKIDGIVGTRGYIAPEIEKRGGNAASARSDIYSLGAMMDMDLFGQGQCPDTLREIIRICRADAPEQRFQSAEQLRDALHSVLVQPGAFLPDQQQPAKRKRPVTAVLAGSLALLLIALGVGLKLFGSGLPAQPGAAARPPPATLRGRSAESIGPIRAALDTWRLEEAQELLRDGLRDFPSDPSLEELQVRLQSRREATRLLEESRALVNAGRIQEASDLLLPLFERYPGLPGLRGLIQDLPARQQPAQSPTLSPAAAAAPTFTRTSPTPVLSSLARSASTRVSTPRPRPSPTPPPAATALPVAPKAPTPEPGAVQFSVDVPVELWMDGARIGEAPGKPLQLPPGRQRIELRNEQFGIRYATTVEVRAGQTEVVPRISFLVWTLQIEAERPVEVFLRLDGQAETSLGTTPVEKELPLDRPVEIKLKDGDAVLYRGKLSSPRNVGIRRSYLLKRTDEGWILSPR